MKNTIFIQVETGASICNTKKSIKIFVLEQHETITENTWLAHTQKEKKLEKCSFYITLTKLLAKKHI